MGFVNENYKKVADTGVLDPGGLFNQPKDQWFGGSRDALDQLRKGYTEGQTAGQSQINNGMGAVDQGLQTLGAAGTNAENQGVQAGNFSMIGQDIGTGALARQGDVTSAMLKTASQQGPSAAEAQMRAGLDQTQNAMMAQAQSARGGNAAAAMRSAQYQGASAAAAVNQQAAALRAQEAESQRQTMLEAQSRAAGIYGGNAQLGFGMQGQGLGLQQSANAQLADVGNSQASIGQNRANMGVQQQSNYLNAETEANKAQLEASRAGEDSKAKNRGGILSGISSGIGSMFG